MKGDTRTLDYSSCGSRAAAFMPSSKRFFSSVERIMGLLTTPLYTTSLGSPFINLNLA